MRWTTLYENTYCDGTFGYERKKLSATNPEQCREAAENDSQCSNTMYYCSSSSAFHCRCVMKNQSCIKGSTSSLECTVERRGNTIVDKTKNFLALNTYKFSQTSLMRFLFSTIIFFKLTFKVFQSFWDLKFLSLRVLYIQDYIVK